jgi:hypothetical protein
VVEIPAEPRGKLDYVAKERGVTEQVYMLKRLLTALKELLIP